MGLLRDYATSNFAKFSLKLSIPCPCLRNNELFLWLHRAVELGAVTSPAIVYCSQVMRSNASAPLLYSSQYQQTKTQTWRPGIMIQIIHNPGSYKTDKAAWRSVPWYHSGQNKKESHISQTQCIVILRLVVGRNLFPLSLSGMYRDCRLQLTSN